MSATEALFWIVFVGGVVGALFNPLYGALLYILIYSLNPETQWWGYNVARLGIRSSFTVAAATIIGLVLNWRSMNRTESQFPLMFKLMLLYLVYCFLVSMSGLQPLGSPLSQFLIEKMIKISIFVFVMIRVIRTTARFRYLLWTWLAGAIYIGYEAWSGVGLTQSGRLLGGLGGPDFSESSGLAAHLVAMMAIAGFLYYSSDSKKAKFMALMAAAFSVNTIIMTRTRNALPGIVVIMALGVIRLPKGLRLKCAAGIIVGLLFSNQLTDEGWWRRMETIKEPEKDTSIQGRFEAWQGAMLMAQEHPFGVGPGNFERFISQYAPALKIQRSAHSTYFEILGEMGYIGIVLFLLIIAAAMGHYERARLLGKRWVGVQERDAGLAKDLRELLLMATAVQIALAGFLTCAAFTNRTWTEGMWLLLAMSCCMRNVAQPLRERLGRVVGGRDVAIQSEPVSTPEMAGI